MEPTYKTVRVGSKWALVTNYANLRRIGRQGWWCEDAEGGGARRAGRGRRDCSVRAAGALCLSRKPWKRLGRARNTCNFAPPHAQ